MQPIEQSRPWLDKLFDEAWAEGGTYEVARDRVISRLETVIMSGNYLTK